MANQKAEQHFRVRSAFFVYYFICSYVLFISTGVGLSTLNEPPPST